jgi:glutathione S-transferase
MGKLQIIGAPQSSYVRTARIVAEERGVAYENVAAPPHSDEVNAIHPLGKIPVLRHGDVELYESKAIVTYLDAAFPGKKFAPDDALTCARIDQFVSLFTVYLQAPLGTYLFAYFFPRTDDGGPDRARIAETLPTVEKYLALFEGMLEDGDYLVGDAFTLADAYLAPILFYLKSTPESGAIIAKSRTLSAYIERCDARPSMKATVPPPLPEREQAA